MTWVNSFRANVVRVNRKLFTHFSVWNRQKIPGEQGEQYNRKKKDAGFSGCSGNQSRILTIGMAKAITNENDGDKHRFYKSSRIIRMRGMAIAILARYWQMGWRFAILMK